MLDDWFVDSGSILQCLLFLKHHERCLRQDRHLYLLFFSSYDTQSLLRLTRRIMR